jgi:rubrerythrin
MFPLNPLSDTAAKKPFSTLTEKEILALAISSEDDDARTYMAFADALHDDYPASARLFIDMAEEEHEHRRSLTEMFQAKFGNFVPLIRRADVTGFVHHRPAWLVKQMTPETLRRRAMVMELENYRFYRSAAERAEDGDVKALLLRLAEAERDHEVLAGALEQKYLTPEAKLGEQDAAKRLYVLQVVQPGLLGLMDGSVSTLAPLFAAAFATQDTWQTFLVGTAASVGAGISMGFAEALSDDGVLSGRGRPIMRGFVAGIMTAIGGLGHTLPFLIADFWTAIALAVIVVFIELWAISWVRYRYMDTPFLRAAFQVAVGGFIVFLAGILIGHA